MNTPLRILIVTRGLPFHSLGGMEAVDWDVAVALAKLSNDVVVLTTQSDTLPRNSTIDGVTVHCVSAPSGRYSTAWWKESQRVFKKEYRDWADIVLSVSAGAMTIAKFRRNDQKFYVQAHGTAWGEAVSKLRQTGLLPKLRALRNIYAMYKDKGYRSFDGLIAVGEKVECDLKRFPTNWIVAKRPVFCVPNGISPERFAFNADARAAIRQRLGIPETAMVGICASRLHAQKGVAETLRGFEHAAAEDGSHYLVIAGDGPETQAIRDQITKAGLNNRVFLLGRIDRNRITDVLSAADYFIFTTKRIEGLPMNVLEALANGLPIIISNHIDSPDFGATAVVPDDILAISNAIRDVSPGDRRTRLPERYTLDNAARAYEKIFRA